MANKVNIKYENGEVVIRFAYDGKKEGLGRSKSGNTLTVASTNGAAPAPEGCPDDLLKIQLNCWTK